MRERYQLDDPFILYAGNIKPHKNLERLIEAFHLSRDGGFELKLLIIGDEISKYAALRRAVHRYKLHKHVRFLGFVPDKTLAILYRLAAVFVFPSLYEGFGLPPLEAMASGTPVSRRTSRRCRRWSATRRCWSIRYEPEAIADGDAARAHRRRRCARTCASAGSRGRGTSPGNARSRRVREIYGEVLARRERRREARAVALVHDWLTGMRGGEKVLEALCELYPDAPLFTLVHVRGSVSPDIERPAIATSFVAALCRAAGRLLPPVPAALSRAVEQFDLDGYDLVISTSHCAAKSVVRARAGACISATATRPMRYAWDQFDAYFGPARSGGAAGVLRRSWPGWRGGMRRPPDGSTAIVANSHYVAAQDPPIL